MIMSDKTGRFVHANASGHAMLRERSVLRERHAATALKEIFAIVGGSGRGLWCEAGRRAVENATAITASRIYCRSTGAEALAPSPSTSTHSVDYRTGRFSARFQ